MAPRVSSDVRAGSSLHNNDRWPNRVPIRRLRARRWPQGSSPSTRTEPADGRSRPVSILMDVDLPAPLGPMKANRSPGATENEIPRTASTTRRWRRRPVANVRWRSSTSMTGAPSEARPVAGAAEGVGVMPQYDEVLRSGAGGFTGPTAQCGGGLLGCPVHRSPGAWRFGAGRTARQADTTTPPSWR